MTTPPADPSGFPTGPLRADVVVLGSGPGGAITACLLAEAGRNVMLLEEGPFLAQEFCPPFSMAEMTEKYRHGGVTAAMGKPPVAYVEARCVGGGSEINSGLYHRTPPEVLEEWRRDYKVEELRDEDLAPHFEANERDLGVGIHPAGSTPASLRLQTGAQALGWKCQEVPRWFGAETPGAPPVRRSMTRTFIPRLLRAGGRLLPGVRVQKIARSGKGWTVSACSADERSRRLRIDAGTVFVACGAVQTPSLLRRSGFGGPIGRTLQFHPTVKVVATFPDPVNQSGMGVGAHQVKEFSPSMSLGCSISSRPYLALALAEEPEALRSLGERWPSMAVYYAMIRGGRGSVTRLPFFDDPWVRQQLSAGDLSDLSAALKRLCDCLLAAGATSLVTPISSRPGAPVESLAEVLKRRGSLMTVHLFSSCPMGEDASRCPVDSFGRVRGADNLFVADASLLCSAPGVNPQGTLMALARRNALRFLGSSLMDALKNARVLVAGGAGWLGRALIQALMAGLPDVPALAARIACRGVRALVRPEEDVSDLRAAFPELDLVQGDLRSPDDCARFCRESEAGLLISTVGVIHPRRVREFYDVNVGGTRNLLAAAAGAGLRRFVAVSSNSPCGCNPHPDHRFDEDSPYQPYLNYGRSKMLMELAVQEAQARGGLETVVVRPPWFYGPFQPARQTLFFRMIRDGKMPIVGSGNGLRSMAYVDNLCQGLLLAGVTPRASGRTYWIADDRPYTMNEIVDTVERLLETEFGRPCARKRLRLPGFASGTAYVIDSVLQSMGLYAQKFHVLSEMNKTIACSIARARAELGYDPKVALEEGMRRSLRWVIDRGLLP